MADWKETVREQLKRHEGVKGVMKKRAIIATRRGDSEMTLSKEDLDIIQGAVNSLTFVRAGLIDDEDDAKALLLRAILTLGCILRKDTDSTLTERVASLEQKVRDLSRVMG